MGEYYRKKLFLSENQVNKFKSAIKNKNDVSLQINPNLKGNIDLYLTKTQINKLKNGTSNLNFSKTQLEHHRKSGGLIFSLPAIIGGISAIAGISTASANIAKAVNQKKHQNRMETEAKKQTAIMQTLNNKKGNGYSKKKSGSGAYIIGSRKYK